MYSLRISDSVGGADYSSKEGANDPELVLTLGGTPVATNTPTLTATPGPSPTPTNTLIATATFTPSPTPILPIFSNGIFTYDGDGKRVKSVITTNIATTTTYFVGAHYEVADGVVTKFYYAGTQRIAMRTNGTLNYLLGDHLGSTSLTTDATGTVISELRYTAWGETRYSSGNTATKYQYTGQYSYASEFGLHYYNARWYDSSLGRFAQADTVVPGSVQGYDRYAYVNNSPINYTDPTGHKPCEEWEGVCLSEDQMTDIWNSQTGNNNDEGGDDNGGDNDEQDDPTGHDYTVTDPVCLDWSWINCTEAEVANYTTQFQYPGQWPWNPVSDLGSYNVWPAEFWGIPNPLFCYTGMCDSGAIWVDIDNNNPLTITNRTQYTHIFNVGDVVRQSKQGADGNWYITTHGKGTNDGYGFIPGPALDYVNQKIGPLVFKAVDLRLVVYTTVAETGQYISSFLP